MSHIGEEIYFSMIHFFFLPVPDELQFSSVSFSGSGMITINQIPSNSCRDKQIDYIGKVGCPERCHDSNAECCLLTFKITSSVCYIDAEGIITGWKFCKICSPVCPDMCP